MQLPGLEALYDDYKEKGIDEVYCLSVNDSFVMNAWAKEHEIENVKMIPDGSGEFTRDMDMIVFKPAQNFGLRSWRYAMIVNDMEIEQMIVEPGKNQQGLDDDPYEETKPENILSNLLATRLSGISFSIIFLLCLSQIIYKNGSLFHKGK